MPAAPPPIIFHHGLGGIVIGMMRQSYFSGIDQALTDLGFDVLATQVHPTAGITTRAVQLKTQILQFLDRIGRPDARVLLVGHSMGGLDARHMIRHLDMDRHVAAALTISTPHRGSPYADWMLRHVGQRLGAMRAIEALGWDFNALPDLTCERSSRFNDSTPDVASVAYFSINASRPWLRMPIFALHSHKVVADAQGANDGLVSLNSGRWATHLGEWPVDHWHAINKRLTIERNHLVGDITPYYIKAVRQTLEAINAEMTQKMRAMADAASSLQP